MFFSGGSKGGTPQSITQQNSLRLKGTSSDPSSGTSTPQNRHSFSEYGTTSSFLNLPNSPTTSDRVSISSSIIPIDLNFPGAFIDKQLPPRIEVTSSINSRHIVRQESGSPNSPVKGGESSESHTSAKLSIGGDIISLDSIFTSKKYALAAGETPVKYALIGGESSVDNDLLSEYIIYNKGELFSQFTYVWRVDLSILTSSALKQGIQEQPLDFLVRFLYSNNLGSDITLPKVKTIISSSKSKVLIIFEKYEKIKTLFKHTEYLYIKQMFDMLYNLKHSFIINTSNYGANHAKEHLKFDITLKNQGYLERDIKKYITHTFENTPDIQKKLLDFFAANKPVQEICKSPSALNMICYIISNINKDFSGNSITLTSLYSDMYSLMINKYRNSNSEEKVNSVTDFMQEFAYISLIKSKIALSEILDRHRMTESELKDLSQEFGLINPSASRYLSQKYEFVDPMCRSFLAALYLKKLLVSDDESKILKVTSFISINRDEDRYLQSIKYLFGLISLHEDRDEKAGAMEYFWSSINSNAPNIVRIDGDNKILLAIELLSQITEYGKVNYNGLKDSAHITSNNKHVIVDINHGGSANFFSVVPNNDEILQDVIDLVNDAVIADFNKWGPELVRTAYISPIIIIKLLGNFLGPDIKLKLQAIAILPRLNIREPEIINWIADKLMHEVMNSNLGIAEASLRSLQYMSDCDRVEEFLRDKLLNDARTNIVLVAEEVYMNLAALENIDKLLSKLDDSNPWIVSGAMDALTRSHHSKQESGLFVLSLIKCLSSENNYIILKSLKTLAKFDYDSIRVFDLLTKKISARKKIDDEEKEALIAIDNLINLKIKGDYKKIAEALFKKISTYSNPLGIYRITEEENKISCN